MEDRFTSEVRAANPDDEREPAWRPVDPKDSFEPEGSRVPWPEDPTALYYWRPTFWRGTAGEPQPPMKTASRVDGNGTCEHCGHVFPYYLIHNGFNDSTYAYCDQCGRLAVLNLIELERHIGKLPPLVVPISHEAENALAPCLCGGNFSRQASARCPSCGTTLSAEKAAEWLEHNAPGTAVGWRWPRSWTGLYAVAISERVVFDPFKRSL